MILHKVHQSPFEHQALSRCIARLGQHDSLVLMESACYALVAQGPDINALGQLERLYVIKEDLDARGITSRLSNCQLISYNDLVELCLSHHQVVSW